MSSTPPTDPDAGPAAFAEWRVWSVTERPVDDMSWAEASGAATALATAAVAGPSYPFDPDPERERAIVEHMDALGPPTTREGIPGPMNRRANANANADGCGCGGGCGGGCGHADTETMTTNTNTNADDSGSVMIDRAVYDAVETDPFAVWAAVNDTTVSDLLDGVDGMSKDLLKERATAAMTGESLAALDADDVAAARPEGDRETVTNTVGDGSGVVVGSGDRAIYDGGRPVRQNATVPATGAGTLSGWEAQREQTTGSQRRVAQRRQRQRAARQRRNARVDRHGDETDVDADPQSNYALAGGPSRRRNVNVNATGTDGPDADTGAGSLSGWEEQQDY